METLNFHDFWTVFLGLLEQVAFVHLNLVKIYVYAYDLRPHLYACLKENRYVNEARLKNHCIVNGQLKDVLIYSKIKVL